MTHFKSKRFSERAARFIRSRHDFPVRRRITGAHILSLTLATFAGMTGLSFVFYDEVLPAAQKMVLGLLIFWLIGQLIYFIAKKYQSLQYTLQATEFMSAAFSAGLKLHCKFCLLVTPEGEIIYMDRVFQEMFPELANHDSEWDLISFFKLYQVPSAQREKITQAVSSSKNDTVELTVTTGAEESITQTLQLFIEPIPHPAGIIMLRGK